MAFPHAVMAAASLSVLLATYPVQAQESGTPATRTVPTAAVIADSIAAQGDTAQAIGLLEAAVRRDKRDAAAWFRLGLLKWNQAKGKRSASYISDERSIRLLIGADSALRLAAQLAPDSARFWNTLTAFNETSGNALLLSAASSQSLRALEAAEKTGDIQQLALAANSVGLAAWRRYESTSNRARVEDGRQVDLNLLELFHTRRHQYIDYLMGIAKRIEPPTGETDFKTALDHFRRALEADPTNQRFARNVFMALGEKSRWEEVRALAKERAQRFPFDFQSRLARGLAAQRLGQMQEARVAFDSALELMGEAERERLTMLSRILPSGMNANNRRANGAGIDNAQAFERLPPAQRQGVTALYWLMADPMMLTEENEYLNEFLARVTWADFRWTSDEAGLQGVDTDRGDVYVRYGPPSLEMTIPGNSSGIDGAGLTVVWFYDRNLAFFFDLMPGFRTAYTAVLDKEYVARLRDVVPVMWRNTPSVRVADSIPLIVTRFRAGGDSLDVVVAASIPVDSLVRDLPVNRVPVDIGLLVLDRHLISRGVELEQAWLVPDSVRGPISRSWVKRVGPGFNLLRVEALQADTRRAARAVSRLEEEATAGFAMSDILIGSSPTAEAANIAARRWRDVEITPSAGTFSNPQVGLVWELYEMTAREGVARYEIEIAVERVSAGLGRIVASIVDGVGRRLGREQRGLNRIQISFQRETAAVEVLVEYITLNLPGASPGEYRLQVATTDRETRRRVTKSISFWIR